MSIGSEDELMVDKLKKEQCTGCKMCADICPKNAISFVADDQGFGIRRLVMHVYSVDCV